MKSHKNFVKTIKNNPLEAGAVCGLYGAAAGLGVGLAVQKLVGNRSPILGFALGLVA